MSHINIDDHTGKVTVGYQAVQAESEIVATETKGNSDSSSESKLKCHVKRQSQKHQILNLT